MNGKKKRIFLGTGIALGAVMLALGGYGLSLIGNNAPLTDADYGEWVVTLAPTCEEKGAETRALLSSPDVTQTREIPALGHTWGEWEEVTLPACMTDGANRRLCSVCGNYDYTPVPALGHDWGEWETVREPACLSEGYDMRVCKHDESHTDLRAVQATGHDWSEWVELTAPTCTHTGIEGRYCRNDNNHTERRQIAALGHDWNEPVVTKEADCTNAGERTRICRNDRLHTETEIIPVLGHAWGEWVTTVTPTYFEEGEEMRICANDSSHTETRSLPILMNAELSFSLHNNGSEYNVRLRNKSEAIGTVEIPATYNGLPVTQIANGGFSRASQITRVVVSGNNLRKIDSSAFLECSKLEEFVFSGDSLWGIGVGAFYKCSGLESFAIPEGVERIGTYCFGECENLKSLSFPASVTYLGNNAWQVTARCPALEKITVAEGNPLYRSENNCLIERETNALLFGSKNCVIPAGVTAIGEDAFADRAIESVRIPESVEVIRGYAFLRCTALSEVVFEGGNVTEIGNGAFYGCTGITRFELPASAVRVGSNAFTNWTEDQTVVVKRFDSREEADVFWGAYWRDSCNAAIRYETGIEYGYDNGLAFFLNGEGTGYRVRAGSRGLTGTVTVPATYNGLPVTEIADVGFAKCGGIERIVVTGGNLKSIGKGAFAYCSALQGFAIPEGVTKIGFGDFFECGNLKSLSFPASLTEIDNSERLYRCLALESVTVAEGNPVFRSEGNCLIDRETNLVLLGGKNAVIPAGVKGIARYAFAYGSIESIRIPESVTDIGSCAFEGCTLLTQVVFEGNGLTKIWEYAFRRCSSLTELTLPASVSEIGSDAFYGCTGIARLELPAGVSHVGTYAFFGWTSEQTIVIKGFASEEEADEAWKIYWRGSCSATIVYDKSESE